MRIKVLHIIDHLGYGGAQTIVKNIAEKMNNKDVETLVCTLRTNPLSIPIKAKVISLPYGKYNPYTILAIAKLCKRYKIDIIHAHLTKSVITSLMARFICRTPVIIHEHGPIVRKGPHFSIYRIVLKMFHNRAAAIIANSQATARQLIQTTGLNTDKVKVILNTIDFDAFESSKVTRSRMREKLGISEKDIVVGFVGRLHADKGVDALIQAVSLLLRQSANYCLVVAGDGPEREPLEALAARLGIINRVRFIGFCDKVAEVMSAFDVGVVPSRREPFGIVVLELMRMKVPVVSSGVDGMAELVSNQQTALVTCENMPVSIADCVERLAGDAQLRRRLTEKAYKFSSQFGLTDHIASIKNVYFQIHENTN